jgi:hypothetical protein
MSMPSDVAMQDRCVHCLREQYMPAVLGISTGEEPCTWCSRKSRQMTIAEYQAALRARLGVAE